MAKQDQAPAAGGFDTMVQAPASTALAVPDDAADESAFVPRQYVTGDVEFSSDELLRPRLRLAQGLTAEVQDGSARPGQWVVNGHDAVDSVVLVPVLMARARELRDEENEDRPILCSSGDAVVGHGNPGGACRECPFNQWRTGPGGKRQPPPCTMIYSYVCWSDTHQAAITVDFKRTSIGIAQFINTMAAHRGFGNFAITVASRSQKGPRGSYYLPTASVAAVDSTVLETARDMLALDAKGADS